MTDEQVRTAIEVLKSYEAGTLSLDNDILDELENAIEAAFRQIQDGEPSETPLFLGWRWFFLGWRW